MSSDAFHVQEPHEHKPEHSHGRSHEETNARGMVNQIALFTATIATVGAIFSYMGGSTQANAGLFKNNAAIKKTEASNQWNYFQAKSTKQALAELAMNLAPERSKAAYKAKVDRYEQEKNAIKIEAEKLEKEATQWEQSSDTQMHQHHRWAQATTILQVSIALAAIALLTKKKWLEVAMFGVGGIGVVIGALATMHI
jgi:Na+/glutamate symporter